MNLRLFLKLILIYIFLFGAVILLNTIDGA